MKRLAVLPLLLSILLSSSLRAETMIDMVVASVDGNPITLHDLIKRTGGKKSFSLSEAAQDPEIRASLDQIILERLIEEEAKTLKIRARDEEIDSYIDEVAKQNEMSRAEFEKALKDSKQSLSEYKRKIKVDILRSRLINSLIRDGAPVTNSEIDEYLKLHPELNKTESKIRLSQIFLAVGETKDGTTRTKEEAEELIKEIRSDVDSEEDFMELAKKHSDSPEGREGGSLGTLAVTDLQPNIFEKVTDLETGDVSEILSTDRGFHIFRLDERFSSSDENNSVREDIKKVLEKQKVDEKLNSFFTVNLYKNHHVDKKI